MAAILIILTLKSLEVIVCAGRLKMRNSTFCRECVYLFRTELRKKQHQMIGFITERESVYCAVRTGSLNKTQDNIGN